MKRDQKHYRGCLIGGAEGDALGWPVKKALLLSDGDSDSTGAVTGSILGAYLGIDAIPAQWVRKVEFADVLFQLADDLLSGYQDTEEWRNKYPGW